MAEPQQVEVDLKIGRIGLANASVVVASRNRPALLLDLVSSLARCDPQPLELVVVDDASDQVVDADALRDVVPFPVRVLRNDRSVGPGASRNRGVSAGSVST